MPRSIRWLFVMMLFLSTGFDTVASETTNRTKDYTWLLFLKVNEPPVVLVGADKQITYPTNSVYLNATVTDDPADTLTYQWSKYSGPGTATFTSPKSVDTTVSFNKTGTYVLQLWVSDGRLASTDLVTITYNNRAPTVDAGADKQITHPTNSVYLNATVTDDPNDTITSQWSKYSGPGTATFASPQSVDTTVSFNIIGTYILQLRASDGSLASTDTVTVKYLPASVKIDVITAFGDSITAGWGDSDCNPCSGYPPVLKNRLSDVHTIYNEGNGGKTSAWGRDNIQRIINKHPDADQYLVMFGTNDAAASLPLPVPSGVGLNPGDSGYPGSFKDNMQRIINAIKSAGELPVLAKVPYAKGTQAYRNTKFQQFNRVVDELVAKNAIKVSPPDFYSWFKNHQDQINSYFLGNLDNIHPNHEGYKSMAIIWDIKLNQ